MKNPFLLEIAQDADFCDRTAELEELTTRARNSQKVLLYSPRHYGKSSLVMRMQNQLAEEGFVNVYVDLFPISSEADVVSKFAAAVFKGIGRGADPRTLTDKMKKMFSRFVPHIEILPDRMEVYAKFDKSAGFDLLLDDLMESTYAYVTKHHLRTSIVLDEFQEIMVLPEAKKIEGILRSYIQRQKEISYFFVGSRRRVLTEMFTEEGRPFHKTAYPFELGVIPKEDFVPHIVRKFKETKKKCSAEVAGVIYDMVRGYPYYVQKLSSIAWDLTETACSDSIASCAYGALLKMEGRDFEGIWSGLTLGQKALLKAIAQEPAREVFSRAYLAKCGLSSGGAQKALSHLRKRDLIEVVDEVTRITDPVMGDWLSRAS
jgi:hypothetical protein